MSIVYFSEKTNVENIINILGTIIFSCNHTVLKTFFTQNNVASFDLYLIFF